MTTEPVLIFLHIPKTAGMTFHKILERNYNPNRTLTFSGDTHPEEIESFIKLPEPQRAHYRLIKGHLGFGLHRFVPGNSTYITFMREPIARALSFYYHASNHPDHYLYRSITEEGVDLKTLLNRGTTEELFNLQTRMIAGYKNNSVASLDSSVLENAKENVRRHFCLVALTEQFDASLLLLHRAFDWRLPFYLKKNVNPRKQVSVGVNAKTLALLSEANALDLELYEFARTLFETRRRAAGSVFESELRRFQRLNRVCAPAQETYHVMKHGIKRLASGARKSASSRG